MADRHYQHFDESDGKNQVSTLIDFLNDMRQQGRKVFLYVPPMSSFYRRVSPKEKIDAFYAMMKPVLEDKNTIFFDYFDAQEFDDSLFQDYYHLNQKGSDKLTQVIAPYVS